MKKIHIGFIPTRRDVFSAEQAQKQKSDILHTIRSFDVDITDIEDINVEGLLYSEEDLTEIIVKMKSHNVDGLFFPHCNFGSEDLVCKIAAEIKKPILIWGPRDDSPDESGLRTRDTQCGLFATGKVLRRFNLPFTYIENCHLRNNIFTEGFSNFLGVCSVVNSITHMRVLQIGTRPSGFWSVICNEGELLEKFGVQLFPVTLVDIVKNVKQVIESKSRNFLDSVKHIKSIMDTSEVPNEELEKLAGLKVVIKDLCIKHTCNSVAIQCWNSLQESIGIMPCIVNGILSEEGIPVACETDIHGAVSSLLLQAASLQFSPVFFADLTIRHPSNDNAELLWHCGNFPQSLAKSGSMKKLGRHFIFPSHMCGTGEWELKKGDITICRFDGDHGKYKLFVGEGRATDGPKTRGTYVWFEVQDWPAWERIFVEGPYIHHCSGIYGKYKNVLLEAVKYIPNLSIDTV